MATEGQPIPIPDLVVASVNENPLLTHVRTVSDPRSLLKRNTIHADPYLYSVHLYVAFREPEYDPANMNRALNGVTEGLNAHGFKGTPFGARLYYGGFGHGSLLPATLYLDEQMGLRTETSTWTFGADNPNAREVMAQAGIEVGQEYTKIEEKPMQRQISTIIFPSIPLANLAALYEEMSIIPYEDRLYPFRNSLYAYHGALSFEDLEKLKQNPAHVQVMADRAFVGYRVPGITRTLGRVGRIVRSLGLSPS